MRSQQKVKGMKKTSTILPFENDHFAENRGGAEMGTRKRTISEKKNGERKRIRQRKGITQAAVRFIAKSKLSY